MSTVLLPGGDGARVSMLQAVVTADARDREGGQALLPPELITEITELLPAFGAANQAVSRAKAGQRAAVLAANTAQDALRRQIRGVWTAVQNRVAWQQASPVLYSYYGLSSSGVRPDIRGGRPRLLTVAQELVDGDAEAAAAGFGSMLADSGFAPALETARQRFADVAARKAALQTAQRERKSLRAHANRLCADVPAQLRTALRRLAPSDQQNVMRGYGVRFRQEPGQPPQTTESQVVQPVPTPEQASDEEQSRGLPVLPALFHAPAGNGVHNGARNGSAVG